MLDRARPLTSTLRPIVWSRSDERVRDVAERIGDSGQSCALVRFRDGFGIITDHDFRQRVATGELGPDTCIGELARTPVLTIDDGASHTAALLRMIEHGVHHLVVVAAGEPVGVVRAVDLARAEIRDPLLIRSAVDNARTLAALADAAAARRTTLVAMRDAGLAATEIGTAHASLIDAIVRRAIELRADPVLARVEHSWILLGSLARREPLPKSDVDTALLWSDPAAGAPDPAEAVRAAAGELIDDLTRCDLRPCPNGANANNPLFSRSQSAWLAAAREWMHDPTRYGALLLSAMITDSRPLTNVTLGAHLTDALRTRTRSNPFLRALLDEALAWRPPVGFLRDFVVLHSGEHRGELDLKRGGLAPVVALGRWITIVTGDAGGGTTERLRRGADAGLLTRNEEQTLTGGYEAVYALVFDREAAAIRTGTGPSTFVNPGELDLLTRRHLRETFRAIAAVQNRVDQDWVRRLG
jgi:CBS domain-containing protein